MTEASLSTGEERLYSCSFPVASECFIHLEFSPRCQLAHRPSSSIEWSFPNPNPGSTPNSMPCSKSPNHLKHQSGSHLSSRSLERRCGRTLIQESRGSLNCHMRTSDCEHKWERECTNHHSFSFPAFPAFFSFLLSISLEHCCPIEVFETWKCSLSVLSSMVATNHLWLWSI